MTRLLSVLLVLVLVTSNVSKWYLDLGPRLSFYVPLLLLFTGLLAIDSLRRPLVVPRPLRVLAGLKVLLVMAMALTLPIVVLESRIPLALFSKGLANEFINAMGIIAVMFFAARLDSPARRRMRDWYLVAVGVSAVFTLAEGVAAYGFATDLDKLVTDYVPLWREDAPSIDEDIWGLSGRRFYRLSGLTGDPNLNAVMFLLAMPILYLRLQERFSLRLVALLLLSLAIIGQTLSNTAISIALLLLTILNFHHLRRAKKAVAVTFLGLVGAAAYMWMYEHAVMQEILRFKLDPSGTTATHIEIALEALNIWRHNPLGVGINGFAVYSWYYSAHNSYLQALVELGPVGLIAMTAGAVYCTRLGLRARNAVGFATVLAGSTLLLSAVGVDVLRRPEFQLVIHMLAAFAVLDARDVARARRQYPSGRTRAARAQGRPAAAFPVQSPVTP